MGYLGEWSKYFAFGASYQTKVWMSGRQYSGLFAEQGDFDIPANWVAGIAIKPTENVDIAVDVQQVLYSGVASVANPLLPNLMQSPLGTDAGAGFGWEDMTTIKGGVQLRAGEGWTWRTGYSYGSQPIPDSEVLFNILAPGVVEQHLTFGFSKMISNTQEISLAVMRAFSTRRRARPPRGAGPADDRAEDGPVGLRAQLVLRHQEVAHARSGQD